MGGEELVALVVEVEAVEGVFFLVAVVVGVDGEGVVEVEDGDSEFLGCFFYNVPIKCRGHSVAFFNRVGRRLFGGNISDMATGGGHKDNRRLRVLLTDKIH